MSEHVLQNELHVVLDEGAYEPERAHAEDAGLDLRTPIAVTVPARGFATIDTGVHVGISKFHYGKLESKSGLNVKHHVVSCGGVIDCGYTGSIVAELYNLSNEDYTFNAGDKIVQLIIKPCDLPVVKIVDELPDSDRGVNGFGSSGK